MRRTKLQLALLFWGWTLFPAAAASPWSAVEKILGRPGQEQGDHFRVEIPRNDLNVTVQGVPLEPGLALTSRFYFQTLPKGTLMLGDLVLLEREVPRVSAEMTQNGFQITGVHGFLLNESPPVQLLHIKGQGSRANLAQALRRVLTAKPLNENTWVQSSPTPAQSPTVTALPAKSTPSPSPTSVWLGVESALGPGKASGKVLTYNYPPSTAVTSDGLAVPPFMGLETSLRFQKVNGTAVGKKDFWNFGKVKGISKDMVAALGRFILARDQAGAVRKRLERNHAKIAFQRELDCTPRMVELYVWVLGPSSDTAAGIQEALDIAQIGQSK